MRHDELKHIHYHDFFEWCRTATFEQLCSIESCIFIYVEAFLEDYKNNNEVPAEFIKYYNEICLKLIMIVYIRFQLVENCAVPLVEFTMRNYFSEQNHEDNLVERREMLECFLHQHEYDSIKGDIIDGYYYLFNGIRMDIRYLALEDEEVYENLKSEWPFFPQYFDRNKAVALLASPSEPLYRVLTNNKIGTMEFYESRIADHKAFFNIFISIQLHDIFYIEALMFYILKGILRSNITDYSITEAQEVCYYNVRLLCVVEAKYYIFSTTKNEQEYQELSDYYASQKCNEYEEQRRVIYDQHLQLLCENRYSPYLDEYELSNINHVINPSFKNYFVTFLSTNHVKNQEIEEELESIEDSQNSLIFSESDIPNIRTAYEYNSFFIVQPLDRNNIIAIRSFAMHPAEKTPGLSASSSSSEESHKQVFTQANEAYLQELMRSFENQQPNYQEVAEKMNLNFQTHFTGKQIYYRWIRVSRPGLVKGNWSKDEDKLLQRYYDKFNGNIKEIHEAMQTRSDLQIKLRLKILRII